MKINSTYKYCFVGANFTEGADDCVNLGILSDIFAFGLLAGRSCSKDHGIQNITDKLKEHKIKSPGVGQPALGNMLDCQ